MGDTFTNPFSLIAPSGASQANGIDGYILDGTKKALDERFEQEHYSLNTGTDDVDSPTGQGRHKAGKVGAWGKGPSLTMRATTGAGTGAFWEITDTDAGTGLPAGTMFRYENGWVDAQFGSGVAYATSAEIASVTPPADKSISAASLRQADDLFLPLTAPITVTTDLVLSTLTGAGIIPAQVRQLHIELYLNPSEFLAVWYESYIKALHPDGVERYLGKLEVTSGQTQYSKMTTLVTLPVNLAQQPTITFSTSPSGYNNISIFGVTQHSYLAV